MTTSIGPSLKNPIKSLASMADSPPDEDMVTSPEPSKVPPGLRDQKDQDESSEIETEDTTLDLKPVEGTEVFECPGNCDEFEPCGSGDCNALDGLHIKDDGEEEEGQGTRSWAKDDEEVVHTQSPKIPTSEADFIAWNRRIEQLRKQALELHVSNLMVYRICKDCNCIDMFRSWTALLITERNAKL
jgi:hypothetical protein